MNMESSYLLWAQERLGVAIASDYQISIRDLGEGERGVFCGDVAIPANQSVIQIPITSILSILSLKSSPLEPVLSSVREEDALAVLLLYEKFVVGCESKWSEHIAILPKEYHSISNYSMEELELIRGSNLYSVACQWKTQIQQDFQELKTHLTIQGIGVLPTEFLIEVFAEENYHWALSTIWSRFISISLPDEDGSTKLVKGMVPMVDLLNHSVTAKMSHFFNEATGMFELFTAQDWKSGEELFINYGLWPNSRFLMLYGFSILGNPDASVDVWASMDPSTPDFTKKCSLMQAIGFNCQEEPFKLKLQTPPEGLLAFLRLQHMGPLTTMPISAAPKLLQPCADRAMESAIRSSLCNILQGMLEAYPQSIDDDEAILRRLGMIVGVESPATQEDKVSASASSQVAFHHPSSREVQAVIMRHSEKRVLQANIKSLS